MAVVHFGDLDIVTVLCEDAGGLLGEPEQGIDADRIIRRANDGDLE